MPMCGGCIWARGSASRAASGEADRTESQRFFFEKKKQKTLIRLISHETGQ